MKGFQKWRKRERNNFYFPILLIAFIIFLILALANSILFFISASATRTNDSIKNNFSKIIYYPQFNSKNIPSVSAESYIIGDLDSQRIILSHNSNLRSSPASTTKIMTAILGLQNFKLNQILTIKSLNIPPVVAGFIPGQQLNFESLLYSMMLPSDNDAAIAIADNYPGGQMAFVQKMNDIARQLNLYNTHYADPVGLVDDGDYTTALDLFRLSAYAIKNMEFRKVVSTKEKIITTADNSESFDLVNLNELLGYEGVFGIKTGYTEDAGQVLVTALNKEGHTIIIVVMNSQDRFADTKSLIDNVVEKVNYQKINL